MSSGNGSTLLVTGANGFVGSSLLASATNRRCMGLVREGRSSTIQSASGDQIRSIREWNELSLFDALDGVDTVVHAASVVHRPGAPDSDYEAFNAQGTRALVAACAKRRVRRFIYLGSIKVYGENPKGIIDEGTPTAPEGAYAKTKLDAEEIVQEASGRGELSTAIFRLSPVYGVGDKGNVRTMVRAIARRRFAVPGDGSTRKSLVHVTSVIEAILAAADSSHQGIFVLADNDTPTLGVLADTIARALGRSKPPRMPAPVMVGAATLVQRAARLLGRPTAISPDLVRKSLIDTVCSPALAEKTFGFRCHRELEPSIREEVTWLRKQEHLV